MNTGLKKQLLENGADVETTIDRFMGNEDFYLKFLMKLQDDRHYENLQAHLEAQKYEDAFNDAHSLKGVSANLGLNTICEASSKITELLRGKKTPEEIDLPQVNNAAKQLGELCVTFRRIIAENAV